MLPQLKEGHAERAAQQARTIVATSQPGLRGQTVLAKLGGNAQPTRNLARDFNRSVSGMGFALRVPIIQVDIVTVDGTQKHPIIPIQALAKEILTRYPEKLFSGKTWKDIDSIHGMLRKFWRVFRATYPSHPVFETHANNLHFCVPVKAHTDEGTGKRKTAVLVHSWGPVMRSGTGSWDQYFHFAMLLNEDYKAFNQGYELGNAVVDSLMQHFASQATSTFYTGINIPEHGCWHLVFVAHEGDLPAQAKLYHLKRNFNCDPNEMCPWCMANDRDTPYTDANANARWMQSVFQNPAWTNPSPLLAIPGASHPGFVARDIFHLCHLGIVRTFCVSLICYLVHVGHFIPADADMGRSVPVCLKEAYCDFRSYCKLVHETPHVKHFSRENLGWLSLNSMPEASFKASDVRLLLQWLLQYMERPFLLDDVLVHASLAAAGRSAQPGHNIFICKFCLFFLPLLLLLLRMPVMLLWRLL